MQYIIRERQEPYDSNVEYLYAILDSSDNVMDEWQLYL